MPVQDVSRTQLEQLLSDDASALLDALMSFIPMGLTIAEPRDVRIVRVSEAGAAPLGRSRDAVEVSSWTRGDIEPLLTQALP